MSKMAMASSLVRAKQPQKVPMERIKIDRLGLTVVKIGITLFGAAFCLTNILPVRRLITGPPISGCIHKALSQINRMPKKLLPVAAQAFQTHGQELGGKILNYNHGQTEK